MSISILGLKYSVLSSAVVGFSWCFSHGFIAVEDATRDTLEKLRAEVVERLATQEGFVRPKVDKESALKIARKFAVQKGISFELVKAVMEVESGGNQHAVSSAGAVGFMQIMPFNAKRCGLTPSQLMQPEENISCGVEILADNLREQKSVDGALQAYNGGPKCVGKCAEAISYSSKVSNLAARYGSN